MNTAPAGERCAYLVSRYPLSTHAFILNEVRAMRASGLRVETASIRRVPPEEVLSPADQSEYEGTFTVLPTTLARLLRAHASAALRAPRAYLATAGRALRLSAGAPRDVLWQLFYFAEAILLWRWLESRDVRHVHVHHANVASDVASLACHFGNSARGQRDTEDWTWSVTIHGPTELTDVTGYKLSAKVADAAAVVCTSDYVRSQILALGDGTSAGNVHAVHCGIDTEAFRRDGAQGAGRGEEVQVLTVAALEPRKGLDVLLRALAQVAREHPAVHLTVVGEGAERGYLEGLVAELGLGPRVRLLGAVGQHRLAELYGAADVFCLPSFAEGVPTVLMEAMSMELPVVATHIMGVPELVEDGRSGLLVPPGRADLLANALARLTADPALRASLAAAARARVESEFELTSAVSALRRVLDPLIRAAG